MKPLQRKMWQEFELSKIYLIRIITISSKIALAAIWAQLILRLSIGARIVASATHRTVESQKRVRTETCRFWFLKVENSNLMMNNLNHQVRTLSALTKMKAIVVWLKIHLIKLLRRNHYVRQMRVKKINGVM